MQVILYCGFLNFTCAQTRLDLEGFHDTSHVVSPVRIYWSDSFSRVADSKNKLYMTIQNTMIPADLPRTTKSSSISNDTLCHTGFGCLVTRVEKRTKGKQECSVPVTIILSFHMAWVTKEGIQTRETEIEEQGLLSWEKNHKSLTPLSWNDLLQHVKNKAFALMLTLCRPKAKLKIMLPINEG